jgi:hypothetical protein
MGLTVVSGLSPEMVLGRNAVLWRATEKDKQENNLRSTKNIHISDHIYKNISVNYMVLLPL